MSLRILLCGVFSPGSTDNWKVTALRRLGHTVVSCHYREVPVEEQHKRGVPFDLVFVSKGVPLGRDQLAHLRSLANHGLIWWPDPFANWNEDLSAAVGSGEWRLSATSRIVLARIAARMAGNNPNDPALSIAYPEFFERILEGCDCEGPWPAPAEIVPALLHFGHLSDRRKAIIETLRSAGIEVNHLEKPLYGARLQKEVLRHAAVLGLLSSPDLYSNRVVTVAAMGGVILQESADKAARWTMGELPFVTPGPLGFFENEEQMILFARARIGNPESYRSMEAARDVFARYSWTKCMERALAFAVTA